MQAAVTLADALKAVSRERTLAAIYAHLAEYTASCFRGTDSKGPTKLLRGLEGAAGRAAVEDVLVAEAMLAQAAAHARARFEAMQRSAVALEQCDVDGEGVDAAGPKAFVVDGAAATRTSHRPR